MNKTKKIIYCVFLVFIFLISIVSAQFEAKVKYNEGYFCSPICIGSNIKRSCDSNGIPIDIKCEEACKYIDNIPQCVTFDTPSDSELSGTTPLIGSKESKPLSPSEIKGNDFGNYIFALIIGVAIIIGFIILAIVLRRKK